MEYKSFYKTVKGGEGQKCHYPTRLDTYGRGCQHNCNYCYARSLLSFRGLWDPAHPAIADIEKIRRKVSKLEPHTVVRLGGMTDCFQPLEKTVRNTLKTIQALNEHDVEYLIVTKSAMVADDEYIKAMRPDLAHIQITVTCTDDAMYKTLDYEKASLPSQRIEAIRILQDHGFDVAIRLSPLIEEFIDFDYLNCCGVEKAVIEFLRVNSWIKKWFDIDYSKYTLREGGYLHLPLEEKKRILNRINTPSMTVCEDYTEHYNYWRDNFNPNKEDCCNLRREHAGK